MVNDKMQLAKGGEATVYADDTYLLTKLITTDYFITPQFALDRIAIHNSLFPEASLEVKGFGRNYEGTFTFVVEQPFVIGGHATEGEIKSYIEKLGFRKSSKDRGHTYTNETIYLSDLHDENVLKTPCGNIVVIDVDARLNTPELNRGGTYNVEDRLEEWS